MNSTRGRSSPSFVFAVAALVAAVVGYGAWRFLRSNDNATSEELVREFARAAGREVSAFRREARSLSGKKFGDGESLSAALAALDEKAAKTLDRIEEQGEQARARLSELDIAIRTQRNRYQRIETRQDEAKEMVSGVVEDVKARLRGEE
jgi:hypothetical protein